ncbi:MAG: hypothetical protein OXH64_10855 [Rhodospirillaceae bacterium]|nr:hypothetical protein [Rhodospirillaceae bacterium]
MADPTHLKMLPGIRWEILRTLHVGGRLGATEPMLQRVIDAAYIGVTRDALRDQLDYLEKRKLIDVERSELDPWRASLSRHGTDLAEYRVDCEPGIARPALQG